MSKGNLAIRQANGIDIRQRMDGYLDATAMCKAYGKRWVDYYRLESTKEFLAALVTSVGIPTDVLVIVRVTGINDERGTWVHPQVAFNLGQWLSADFAVRVTEWIKDIHEQGFTTMDRRAVHAVRAKVLPVYKDWLGLAKLIGLTGNEALIAASRATEKETGISVLAALDSQKMTAPVQESSHTVTEIARRAGFQSAQACNKALTALGMQTEHPTEEPRYQPTELGKRFAVLKDAVPVHGKGGSHQHWEWLLSVVDELVGRGVA